MKTKSFPFPYYGEGSAAPIRAKDGLSALVVFRARLTAADARAIKDAAPMSATSGTRWIFLHSTERLSSRVLTTWIERVHAAHPVALFFMGSEGKRGAWHADTVRTFARSVRPVLDTLRSEGADDHADWVTTSFLHSGADTSFDDLRKLADQDPVGAVGNIGQRCLLAWPLVEALGPASLAAMGPYAELGFWACASIHELVPEARAHAAHLSALADACPRKRQPKAVPLLLIRAACSLLRDDLPLSVTAERRPRSRKPRTDAFDGALALARKAASTEPLPVGLLASLVTSARTLGGAPLAVSMARPFLASTIAATVATLSERDRDRDSAAQETRLLALTSELAADVALAPDAAVTKALAAVPKAQPVETPIKGASHPHLARLNEERLHVQYRGSLDAQEVVIAVKGSATPQEPGAHLRRMRDLLLLVQAGLAGAAVFPPEAGEMKVLEGPTQKDTERIEGALPVDDSSASATTAKVLGWLRAPAAAFLPFPELPFPVEKSRAASTALGLTPARMTKAFLQQLGSGVAVVRMMYEAYPTSTRIALTKPAPGKRQVKIAWQGKPPPGRSAAVLS